MASSPKNTECSSMLKAQAIATCLLPLPPDSALDIEDASDFPETTYNPFNFPSSMASLDYKRKDVQTGNLPKAEATASVSDSQACADALKVNPYSATDVIADQPQSESEEPNLSKLLQQLEDLGEESSESKSVPADRSFKLTIDDLSFAETVDVFQQAENEILRKELHKICGIVAKEEDSSPGDTASMHEKLEEADVEKPQP